MKGTNLENKASATAVPTDYCGNMIYENGVLKKVFFDGGYVTVTGTPFYFYYLKDHQGNNRVVVNPDGSSGQVNHYYPFGGLFGESTGNAVQPYKYNGKELDRTHGLDWYDYGARHMAPDASRFTTIDPMAEKYYHLTPYAYCANNPVRYIDLKGDTLTVLDIKAQNNIKYSLTAEEARFVEFDSKGYANIDKINTYSGSSHNFDALKALVNSELNYKYIVSDKTHDGRYFSKDFRGITEFPGAENGASPDNSIWIITSSNASTELQVRNVAHEAYGHAYIYDITRNPTASSHTYRSGTILDWFPEYNDYYPVSVRIPTNQILEEQILRVTTEAIYNYNKFWKFSKH